MAQGYAIFANGGFGIKPHVIDAIYGPDGDALYRADPLVVCRPCEADPDRHRIPELDANGNPVPALGYEQMADVAEEYRPDASTAPEVFDSVHVAPRVISAQNAFLIQDLMRDVVRRGTGRRAMVLGRSDLSGKTGTSNDQRDAWFGGFNASLAAITWVGYDASLPLGPGEEGSRTALPIWIDFMRIALDGVPESQMDMPEGIISVKIDRTTGCPAGAGQLNTMFEYFRVGHEPECENQVDVLDIFNDASGIDPVLDETADPDAEPEEEPDVEEESLF